MKHGNTEITEAILHTSATPKSWAVGKTNRQMLEEIRRWHVQDNGWRDIGYHRVVMPDGEVMIGRSLTVPGAHVAGRNTGTIGICMIGPGSPIGRPEDHYTPAQIRAVKQYLAELADVIDLKRVTGHNDHAARDCPGFKVRSADWMPSAQVPRDKATEPEDAEPPDGTKERSQQSGFLDMIAALFSALFGRR